MRRGDEKERLRYLWVYKKHMEVEKCHPEKSNALRFLLLAHQRGFYAGRAARADSREAARPTIQMWSILRLRGLPNATASELSSLPVPAPLPMGTAWVHTEEFMFVPPGFPL